MSEIEIIDTYEELRYAFERTYPMMVDACDAFSLTVFPFKKGNEKPSNYEVENYITGLYGGMPALQRSSNKNEILVIKDMMYPLLETV